MNDQFEPNGLDSPTYNKGYFQKASPVVFPPVQEMYTKRFSSSSSASSISDFALTHETSQRESMNAQRQIKDLEKKLGDTLAELERIKKENRDSIELNKTHVRRIKQLEQDSQQLKTVNKSLSNDIATYQAKLVDKDAECKQLETKYYEEKRKNDNYHRSDDVSPYGEAVHKESDHTLIEKLQDEIKTLKSDNESMTQYIQKMLNRIMEVDGFEETLATNWSSSSKEKSSKPVASKPVKPARPNSLKTDFKFPRSPPSVKTSFPTIEDETTNHHDDEPEEYSQQPSSPPLTTFESLDKSNMTKNVSPSNKAARTTSKSADDALSQESPRNVNSPASSIPSPTSNKRISGFFKWGMVAMATATMRNNAEAAKKQDPYMKPILLVQANDKARDWKEA